MTPHAAGMDALGVLLPVLLAGLVGWVWGSFLNQWVDRTPRAAEPTAPSAVPVSLFRPRRSVCLQCGAAIAWQDNIPVFSYLRLGGRCRSCRAAIGVRTLVLECATPLAFAVAAGAWTGLRPGHAPAWSLALPAALALSAALMAGPLLAERRRLGPLGWLGGLALALGMALAALEK